MDHHRLARAPTQDSELSVNTGGMASLMLASSPVSTPAAIDFDPAVADFACADLAPEVLTMLNLGFSQASPLSPQPSSSTTGPYSDSESDFQRLSSSPTDHHAVAAAAAVDDRRAGGGGAQRRTPQRSRPYQSGSSERIPDSRANWPAVCPLPGCPRSIDATRKGDFSVRFNCCGNCARKIRNRAKRELQHPPSSPAYSSGSSSDSHQFQQQRTNSLLDSSNPFATHSTGFEAPSPASSTMSQLSTDASVDDRDDSAHLKFLQSLSLFPVPSSWSGARLARLRNCIEREFGMDGQVLGNGSFQVTRGEHASIPEQPVEPQRAAPSRQSHQQPQREKAPWYHGALPRERAIERLNSRGRAGSFLVRKSISSYGNFSVSVRAFDGVRHIRVVEADGGYSLNPGDPVMGSLDELIRHHMGKDLANVDNASDCLQLRFPLECVEEEFMDDVEDTATKLSSLSVQDSADTDSEREHTLAVAGELVRRFQDWFATRKNVSHVFFDVADVSAVPEGRALSFGRVQAFPKADVEDSVIVAATGTYVPSGSTKPAPFNATLAIFLQHDVYRVAQVSFRHGSA
eukprot:m.480411 g.480411  ORF g.480411 m.480411 type:complete len:573 (+) comp21832_c0_seq1:267-1985(+)